MSSEQTILQQQSIADTPTDWQQVLPFEQFDPSLGTLDSINIGVTADIAGSVSVESLEAAASTVDIGQFGNLSVNGPTGINLVSDPVDFSGAWALGAYDGTTDYGGTSGTVVAVANTGTANVTLSSSTADLGPFVGTGSVTLSAYANVALSITGPANMQIDSQASVGGTVDLQYNYASTTTAGPGGGGGVVTTTSTAPLPPFEIANAVTATPLVVAVPDVTTGSSTAIDVAQFDPSLGALEAINVTLIGDLATSVSAENEDASAAFVSTTQDATVSLSLAGVSESTDNGVATGASLGGYDGTADYAGTSGTIIAGGTQMPAVFEAWSDPADLAAFTGTGTVSGTFASSSTASLDGPGNLLAKLQAEAGGTVEVSYVYVPAGVSSDAIGWADSFGGVWTNGDDWSSYPNPPAATDDVDITLPGSYAVTLDAAETVNNIVIDSPNATLVVDANLTATGNFTLDAGTIVFENGTISAGNIDINAGLVTGGTVNLTASDTIEFGPTAKVDAGVVVLTTPHGTTGPLCFCAGTSIATPDGDVPVERLSAGDLVLTRNGGAQPIVWIGAGKVLATRLRRSAATPVIVRKSALADNVPHHDLRVTKAHAFYLDEVLIPVEFLVNHRSIIWDDRAQEVSLYHVELARHDILLANGAPAESYRDDGNRWLFQNASPGWDAPATPPCAPVLTGGPIVDAIWRRLLDRAGPRKPIALTGDPDLHLRVDGERADPVAWDGATACFRLARRPGCVRIASRADAPAELGVARDPRVLGVALRQMMVRQGSRVSVMPASDPSLADGFHGFEQEDGIRWTGGDAAVPDCLFLGFDGPLELILHVGGSTRYSLFGGVPGRSAA
jgi:hypothetical protein